MNRKEQNIAVFEDTMDWIKHESALSAAVKNSITHTVLYPAQQMLDLPESSNRSKTKVTVTPQRTFEAAQDLLIRYPGSRAAVLNFASATNPGGGVTRAAARRRKPCAGARRSIPASPRLSWTRDIISTTVTFRTCATRTPASMCRMCRSSRRIPMSPSVCQKTSGRPWM